MTEEHSGSVCCPGVVKTEFHEVQGMDMSGRPRMTSEDVVSATLAGLEQREVVCVPVLEDAALVEKIGEAQRAILMASMSGPPEVASRYRG